MRPELAKRDADDGELQDAWIDACETALCLDAQSEAPGWGRMIR